MPIITTEPPKPTKALERLKTTLAIGGKETILLVIDRSGSMETPFMGAKGLSNLPRIEAAKNAVEAILRASHRGTSAIGLAVFNHECTVLEKPGSNFTGVMNKALLLNADGGTRYEPVFSQAFELQVNRVILLSDGEPEDRSRAVDLAETACVLGIRFDCVGIGESNPELLKAIASATGGVYAFADHPEELLKTFRGLETRARFQIEHKPNAIKL